MSGWTDGQPEMISWIKDRSGDQWFCPTEQLFSACFSIYIIIMIQISTWIISWYRCRRHSFVPRNTIFSATGNLVKQLFRKSLNKSQRPVRVDYDSYICWGILKNYTFTVSTLKCARLKVFCSCNQVRLVLEPEIKHQLNTEVISGWSCLCDVTLVLSPTGQPLLLSSQYLFLQTLWRSSKITKTSKTWSPNLKLRCSSYLWWEETWRTSSLSLSLLIQNLVRECVFDFFQPGWKQWHHHIVCVFVFVLVGVLLFSPHWLMT